MARHTFHTPEAVVVVSTHAFFDVYPCETTSYERRSAQPVFRASVERMGGGIRLSTTGDDSFNMNLDDPRLEMAVRIWSRRYAARALAGDLGTSPDRLG